MRVLGDGRLYDHPIEGRFESGVWIPNGALERWFTARRLHASRRVEVVTFGDSTTVGSEQFHDDYAWIDRLRDRVTNASLTDGGKGIFGGQEVLMVGRDATYEVNGFVSSTCTGVSDSFDSLFGQFYRSSAKDEVLTVQGYGNELRLNYAQRPTAGGIGVTIDGGTEQTVETGGKGDPVNKHISFALSGTRTTLHTVAVRNLGGPPVLPPSGLAGGTVNVVGTLTIAQNYYYAVTTQTAAGETTISNVAGPFVPATNFQAVTVSINGAISANNTPPSGGTYAVYRATSSSGPFLQIATRVAVGSSQSLTYTDAGDATGSAAPSTNTAGRDSANAGFYVAPAFQFSTGILWTKQATNGGTFAGCFAGGGPAGWGSAHASNIYQTPLGLTPGTITSGSPTSADGYAANNTVDTSYTGSDAIAPVLAMTEFVFNDLTAAPTDFPRYAESIKKFAAACRATGCDGIVLFGNAVTNDNWPAYGQAIFDLMKSTALGQGLGFADMWWPFGGSNGQTSKVTNPQGPHLAKQYYQQQADFLWDNLLGL